MCFWGAPPTHAHPHRIHTRAPSPPYRPALGLPVTSFYSAIDVLQPHQPGSQQASSAARGAAPCWGVACLVCTHTTDPPAPLHFPDQEAAAVLPHSVCVDAPTLVPNGSGVAEPGVCQGRSNTHFSDFWVFLALLGSTHMQPIPRPREQGWLAPNPRTAWPLGPNCVWVNGAGSCCVRGDGIEVGYGAFPAPTPTPTNGQFCISGVGRSQGGKRQACTTYTTALPPRLNGTGSTDADPPSACVWWVANGGWKLNANHSGLGLCGGV